MKLGVVGLPNVGKSTLFNAITAAGAEAANYPFCTIEPNTGAVPVPDARLDTLARMYNPEKITPALLEFVDIAGLVRGASKGEGLGNKFLSHIREVDAVVHVVRCFDDENITHVDGAVNPKRDIETIETELILADLETIARRIDRTRKVAQSGDAKARAEMEVLDAIEKALNDGKPARSLTLNGEGAVYMRSLFLLTAKPVLYAANIAEEGIGTDNAYVAEVGRIAAGQGSQMLSICAKVEEEIAQLPGEEKQAFLDELGIGVSGLERLVKTGYRLLGLISYLTAGPKEVRAWTIEEGTKAPQAAGKIHSDFERGFIRAEVVGYDELVACGSMNACKEKGLVRSEGKDYVFRDGDVVLFRFNV